MTVSHLISTLQAKVQSDPKLANAKVTLQYGESFPYENGDIGRTAKLSKVTRVLDISTKVVISCL